MGEIVLMLHVANVACCNSHGGAIFIIGLPARIVSVSELKESTFVIPRANLVMDVFLFCATITTFSCSDDDSIQEC